MPEHATPHADLASHVLGLLPDDADAAFRASLAGAPGRVLIVP